MLSFGEKHIISLSLVITMVCKLLCPLFVFQTKKCASFIIIFGGPSIKTTMEKKISQSTFFGVQAKPFREQFSFQTGTLLFYLR